MWGVIPAAGAGTRMADLAPSLPKPLLSLGEESLLERILRDVGHVVDRTCLVIPTGESPIRRRLGDACRGMPLEYAIQEEPRGVGDAICSAGSVVDGPFAAVMGDACFGAPLAPYLAAWRDSGIPAAVLVRPLEAPIREPAGLVRVSGERVREIRKGTDAEGFTHRVSGAFMFPAGGFEACDSVAPSESGEVEAEALVRSLLARGVEVGAVVYRSWRRNVNTPDDLREVRERLAAGPPAG